MPVGPGKYDELCTLTRRLAGAKGLLLIVIEGEAGFGFSCQAPLDVQLKLPNILRTVAADIERSLTQGQAPSSE